MQADLPPLNLKPSRVHLNRLMQIWRSAGWPSQDAVEIDLLAAQWVEWASCEGQQTLRLTPSGIRLLAEARQQGKRANSAHDKLAGLVAQQLMDAGRIVWQELSLRAQFGEEAEAAETLAPQQTFALLADPPPAAPPKHWRMARPDVFSLRNTSVARYLHPVIHEIKVSRADLFSDLRNKAKHESYQWLCSELYYVFPAGTAEPKEIPAAFGIWLLHGKPEDGQLELLRPARHRPCELPFPVWMALAKATPSQGPQAQAADPEQAGLQDESPR
ncbi:hypothetical protein HNP55_003586 [Paucibacter oligotrophus]|uniref:Uncharacterized protein n=1 Tax=Roseateles oligotrophus TaxID=1769250 RepID=A0A840LA40_9BURK|nr:hypothetical protein [Roseateles oligotrophus]MBB4845040.1 hypothetical protein [Roseateles oligotrophus]